MEKISLAHGSGGKQTNKLINDLFVKYFSNNILNEMGDSAHIKLRSTNIALTTDSFVIKPLFFNGGNIGKLAVCGTVNDLCVSGAKPFYITSSFIIEEGFLYNNLEKIVKSMAEEAKNAGVEIVAGDTKVVERGEADGLFINTTGIGVVSNNININPRNVTSGDVILINGTIGDHGTAIICERNSLGIKGALKSDCAALSSLTDVMLKTCPEIKMMRDATRGGLAAVLNEIAIMSKVDIIINESSIPINEEVKGACELLGLDPLYIANEGKLCVFIQEEYSKLLLSTMREHPLGKNAQIIGKVGENSSGRVYLKTNIGGQRFVDMPSGILLPRIC